MEISNASVSRYLGKFNWANPAEEGAQITVRFTADGANYVISDVVEPHSQHDYDGDDISDAIDAISNAIERYWISTGRDETKTKIAFFWKHEALIRKAYAATMAARYQRIAAINAKRAMSFLDEATAEIIPEHQSEAA